MKALFVFLFVMALSVSASPKDEEFESEPENNIPSTEIEEEVKEENFALLGGGIGLAGGVLMAGGVNFESIIENGLSSEVIFGAGVGMTLLGCAVLESDNFQEIQKIKSIV